ncbi:hypothetical protein HDU76_003191 [Blyttiomyces sp. JEL0837]|nr:hypothetical protein HDU76_003191 [Blyttiomyces sp. JEL0837]
MISQAVKRGHFELAISLQDRAGGKKFLDVIFMSDIVEKLLASGRDEPTVFSIVNGFILAVKSNSVEVVRTLLPYFPQQPRDGDNPWVGHCSAVITRLLFTHFRSLFTRSVCEMITQKALVKDNLEMLQVLVYKTPNINWLSDKVLSESGCSEGIKCLTYLLRESGLQRTGWTKNAFATALRTTKSKE